MSSFIKRTIKSCKKYRNKVSEINVIGIINEKPNSKGVFSFSLFGNLEDETKYKKYVEPILYSSKIVNNIAPDWCIRVYLSSDVSKYVRDKLIEYNCEIYLVSKDPNNKFVGTLWRFLPASETKPFIVCDADMKFDEFKLSYSSLKKSDIDSWLKSDKNFFVRRLGIINNFVSISAGMWGGKPTKEGKPLFPQIKDQIEHYEHKWFGTDECFLSKEVYPKLNKSKFIINNKLENILFFTFWLISIIILFRFTVFKKKS
jgi:hypothetical protein